MSSSAIYAGSFDPITYGHLDIIERMSALYSSLIVVVAQSPWKKNFFSMEERTRLIQKCVQNIPHVSVDFCEGLLVDYAKKKNIKVFIRGVRAVSDFEHELDMSNTNKTLYPECETLIAFTRSKYSHFSSKMVQEAVWGGGDVSSFVPPHVNQAIQQKVKK